MKMINIRRRFLLLIRIFALVAGSVVGGLIALTLVFMLPADIMKQHVSSSIDIFYTESVYPMQVQGYKSTQLDNETDAIMLLGAIHETDELNPLQQAVAVPHITMSGVNSKCITLKNYLWDNMIPDGESNYDRYWHGYMLYLKPLLLFMDYADIRVLNMILQTLLLLYLLRELVRKRMEGMIPALGIFVVILNPAANAMSLQFSSIYYIVLISLLILVKYKSQLFNSDNIYFFFAAIGIAAAYFDFLTYPIAAFIVPASVVLSLDDKNWKRKIVNIVKLGLCWGIGYIGMWAGKWIIGSLILDTNILAEAFGRMTVHSGEAVQMDGKALSAWEVLWKNIKVLLKWPYFLLAVATVIYYGKAVLFKVNRKTIMLCIPFLILCLIPCIWIMLLKSHSLWCYWYTYRNLGSTAFAVVIMLKSISDPGFKSPSGVPREGWTEY